LLAGQICAIVRTHDDRAYTTERTEIGPMRFGPYPSAAVVTSHAKVIRVTAGGGVRIRTFLIRYHRFAIPNNRQQTSFGWKTLSVN